MKNWIFKIPRHEKKIFSQSGQDGVIDYIFSKIGTAQDPPFCIEFGFNSHVLQGGTGANVANLVLNKGWRCLLFDGEFENKEINLHKHMLTSGNICSLLKEYGSPISPDYLSIDVDSIDLWLMRAILKEFRPRCISSEFNANFPIQYAITHPDGKNLFQNGHSTYGASLKALDLVAREFRYTLVCTVSGQDAFFIRNDLIESVNKPGLGDFKDETGFAVHDRALNGSEKEFLDYEEYLANGGDVEKARAMAAPIASRYLAEPYPQSRPHQRKREGFLKRIGQRILHDCFKKPS